jgi:hypothetical protein
MALTRSFHMQKNTLKIEASALKLELSGDQATVSQAYEMTRELLIRCFEEQFSRMEQQADLHTTRPLHVVPMPLVSPASEAPAVNDAAKHWKPSPAQNVTHINIVLASEFYNKVCVLDRVEFDTSILNKILHFDRIDRLYIRHEQYDTFTQHFTIGKVLWRELTANGKAAVRKNPRFQPEEDG